ncbi:sensor histidine kinase [Curvibacter sp. APW13]|uniref:sensor histidine kinase n=1 Tax=Curvibacter sp. APW13 TaxID=3077236 RepID=UPI0028DF3314|nr:sensor histidine kinase [Curvibacter sp. APW13]MDT8993005.1 sensor histidine kinase [Curvibacter sp. APW13]
MKPIPGLSLRRQLLWWLLAPQLILWLMGGVLAYRVALSYAEKALDASLSQSVRSLARQVKPLGSGLLVDFPKAAQAIIEQDPTDRVAYMVSSPPGSFFLGNLTLPAPPTGLDIPDNTPVFYDQALDGKVLRVALMELNYGTPPADQRMRVQVAKSLAAKEVLARELVRDVLIPLLALGTVLSVLVYGGIRRGLAPLQRLEAQLAHRSTAALQPIELTEAPQEVHSLATALNELLGSLRRSLTQEKRFLNDAAHQLRTPLAGLISQSELALQETDPQALRARLQKVHTGAQRSAHLVGQLLALARTEGAIERTPVDVAALAREVAREFARKAVQGQVDLGWEGDDAVHAAASRLLLREALSNLIDNALRYAGAGSTVTVTTRRDGAWCVLGVEDNGPGLRDDQMSHVFERFWRASELPGGCGLGLAIVAEIAQRHGGQAQVRGVSPHGLRVELRLPLLEGQGILNRVPSSPTDTRAAARHSNQP